MEDFYKGCERICKRVAVTLDNGLPQGERWHQVLLGWMGERGRKGRPVLFDGSLLLELDEYRRFRHRVRHIYGYELEAERVLTLAQGVIPVLEQVEAAVATLLHGCEEQGEREIKSQFVITEFQLRFFPYQDSAGCSFSLFSIFSISSILISYLTILLDVPCLSCLTLLLHKLPRLLQNLFLICWNSS